MSSIKVKTCIVLAIGLLSSGCATGPNGKPLSLEQSLKTTFASDDPCSNNSRNSGIAIGALVGVFLGKASGASNDESLLLGGAAGALVGGLIGADMDRRRCELSKIAKKYDLDVTFKDISIDGAPIANGAAANGQIGTRTTISAANLQTHPVSTVSVLAIRDKESGKTPGHFETGSDRLTPKAQDYFGAIAEQYAHNVALESEKDPKKREAALKQYSLDRRILLVGHTDDTGSSRSNADLSERRARAVAEYLKRKGVPEANIYFQGAGETYPVADNRTEEGRATNRRVEIVEAADESGFKGYLEARKPNLALYRANSLQAAPTTADAVGPSTDKATKAGKPAAVALAIASRQSKKTSPAGSAIKNSNKAVVATGTGKTSKPASAPDITNATTSQQRPAGNGLLAAKTNRSSSSVQTESTGPATKSKPASSHASSVATTHSNSTEKSLGDIDFGGTPVTAGNWKSMDIGQQVSTNSSFSFFSTAHAADDVRSVSCAQDRPRHSGDVKNLATGKTYSIREYMPGAARANWGAKVNGHFVGIYPVAVLRDGTIPSDKPNLVIFKNWINAATPDSTIPANVNAYVGDKGLLYRAFPENGPIKCIDVLIDHANPTKGMGSNIVYAKNGTNYQTDYNPTITRN